MADPINLYRELCPLRAIKRFQQHHTLAPISVAEHSFYVALMAGAMASQLLEVGVSIDRAQVIEGALWHDAAEAVTGDVPAQVKWGFPGLRDALDKASDAALAHLAQYAGCPHPWGPVPPTDTLEKVVIKVGDLAELVLYVAEETALGNRSLWYPAQRVLDVLHDGWPAAWFKARGGAADAWYRALLSTLSSKPETNNSWRSSFGLPGQRG